MRLLTPEVYPRMAEMARRVTAELIAVCREVGLAASGNAVGSIFRLSFTETPPRNCRETARDDKSRQRWLFFWLLNRGIHWQQGGICPR